MAVQNEFSPSGTNSFFTASTRWPRRKAFISCSAAGTFFTGTMNSFSCTTGLEKIARYASWAWPAPLRSACPAKLAPLARSWLLLTWGQDNPETPAAVVVAPGRRVVIVGEGRRTVDGVAAPTAAA